MLGDRVNCSRCGQPAHKSPDVCLVWLVHRGTTAWEKAPGFKFTQSPNTEQKVGLCLTGSSKQASHSLANGRSAYLNSYAVTYRNTQWPHCQGERSKSDEWDRYNWLATIYCTVKQLNLEKRKTLDQTLEKLGNILISFLSAEGISWWLKRLLIKLFSVSTNSLRC